MVVLRTDYWKVLWEAKNLKFYDGAEKTLFWNLYF